MSQLQTLAALYGRSIGFLMGEGPLPTEAVLWRQRPSSPDLEKVEALFLTLCEQYHNLEVWCREKRSWSLPLLKGNRDRFVYRDAEALAYQVRTDLQLGDRPGTSLFRVLEEVCGIKIFVLEFEPRGTAACTVSAVSGPAILLNAKNVRWRRNFDLAHELFHVLTWENFRAPQAVSWMTPDDQEEKLATCFARNLLMPREALEIAVGQVVQDGTVRIGNLFDVARQFDVSVEALVWQMALLFRFDDALTKRLHEHCRKLATLYEDRERDTVVPSRPARFFALALKALRQGEISLGRFAEYMGISRPEASRYLDEEALGDEAVQITAS